MTDSGREVRYDPEQKPGVSNLIEIMSVATGEPLAAIEARFDGEGYGAFKEAVGEAVVELLAPIREQYEALRADERELQRLLARRRRQGARAPRSRRSSGWSSGWASSGPRPASCSAPHGRAGFSAARPPCRNLSETASPPTTRCGGDEAPLRHQGKTAQPKRGVA